MQPWYGPCSFSNIFSRTITLVAFVFLFYYWHFRVFGCKLLIHFGNIQSKRCVMIFSCPITSSSISIVLISIISISNYYIPQFVRRLCSFSSHLNAISIWGILSSSSSRIWSYCLIIVINIDITLLWHWNSSSFVFLFPWSVTLCGEVPYYLMEFSLQGSLLSYGVFP